LKEGEYDEAGALCKKILGKSKELWEAHITCFEKENQLVVSFVLFHSFEESHSVYSPDPSVQKRVTVCIAETQVYR